MVNACEYTVSDYTNLIQGLSDNCSDSSSMLVTQTPSAGTIIDARQTPVTTITLTASDTNGNSIQCSFDLSIYCSEELIIPEFISPNGDGQNDVWFIENISLFPNNHVKIFNRYGSLVYEKQNYDNTWDGVSSSSISFTKERGELPSGTYFYFLELGDEENRKFQSIIQIRR